LYSLHCTEYNGDDAEVIPLYFLQSIQLCMECSGMIHKEENNHYRCERVASDESKSIDHPSDNQAQHGLQMTPSRTRGKQFKCGSNRND
jgi:hypothetical protein